jgi:protein-S-isoprenylcysteine O-methyltransferase Ste14
MNSNAAKAQLEEPLGPLKLFCRCLVALTVFALALAASLFIAAGTMNWVMAWAYIGVWALGGLIMTPIFIRVNPELVTERLRLRKRAAKTKDVALGSMMGAFWILGLVTAGFDQRFGWSPPVPPALQLVGLAIMGTGYLLGVWAMLVNRFFAWFVRIQKDRGHQAVTAGPYQFVRHPGYVGGIAMMIATPVILASLWAFIPMGLATCLLVFRTAVEDRTLREELDGYGEYVQKVRYRLLPGVW